MSQSHHLEDFNPDEVTEHGRTSARVRELSDPDAYVMLGRLATAVARCEATTREAMALWKADSDEARKDRDEARKQRTRLARSARNTGISTVGLVGFLQAVIYVLQHAGIIK